MSEVWEGHCLCGEVRFRASGPPKWTMWCHCDSCRRHSGAPITAFASFDAGNVEVTQGAITRFQSSPTTRRGFCARCGSSLTCESVMAAGETHIPVGALARPGDLPPPIRAFFPGERLRWVHLGDG